MSSEPKTWWIAFDRPDDIAYVYSGDKRGDGGVLLHVEVIEKSAYDAAIAEVERLKLELDNLDDEYREAIFRGAYDR